MTQRDLARKMHFDRAMVSRVENGQRSGSVRFWRAAGKALKRDWRTLVD